MDEQVKAKTTDNPDPFTNEFSRQIWEVTYKTQNENSITDTWKRAVSYTHLTLPTIAIV